MGRPLCVAIADGDPSTLDYLRDLLTRLGHQAATAQDGKQLVDLCLAAAPDLAIADVELPGLDGIEAAAAVNRDRPLPFILTSGRLGPELLARLGADAVVACLVKPFKAADVEVALVVGLRRWEQYQAAQAEARELRQALEERKLVERAKGAVMRRLRVDEQEGFRRLKKLASIQNRKLADVSQVILNANEVFQLLERC